MSEGSPRKKSSVIFGVAENQMSALREASDKDGKAVAEHIREACDAIVADKRSDPDYSESLLEVRNRRIELGADAASVILENSDLYTPDTPDTTDWTQADLAQYLQSDSGNPIRPTQITLSTLTLAGLVEVSCVDKIRGNFEDEVYVGDTFRAGIDQHIQRLQAAE